VHAVYFDFERWHPLTRIRLAITLTNFAGQRKLEVSGKQANPSEDESLALAQLIYDIYREKNTNLADNGHKE
jgi:hypothetical protein